MSKQERFYGWVSAQASQRENYKPVTYLMKDGSVQELTGISRSATDSSLCWPDAHCVGEVDKQLAMWHEGKHILTEAGLQYGLGKKSATTR